MLGDGGEEGGRRVRQRVGAHVGPNAEPGSQSKAYLIEEGFPPGLAATVVRDLLAHRGNRVFVLDNSGSMRAADGIRRLPGGAVVQCSRWEELCGTARIVANLAVQTRTAVQLRLLNPNGGPRHLLCRGDNPDTELAAVNAMCDSVPRGLTPLNEVLRGLLTDVAAGGTVTVVTDGEPSDAQQYAAAGGVKAALRELTALGATVVIRLCTDDAAVVKQYHDLDEDPELSLDLLDDLEEEANEVAATQGPWLTYGAPLHLTRELGCRSPLFDLLDERPFALSEVWQFCALLLFDHERELPHPAQSWQPFEDALRAKLRQPGGQTWDPRARALRPWIDLAALRSKHGPPGSSCAVM